MFETTVYEIIDLLVTLSAYLVILYASIRLFLANPIPGSRIIFIAVIGSVVGYVMPYIEFLFFVVDSNYLYESLLNIYMAAMYLLGAIGFMRLVGHVNSNRQAGNSGQLAKAHKA